MLHERKFGRYEMVIKIWVLIQKKYKKKISRAKVTKIKIKNNKRCHTSNLLKTNEIILLKTIFIQQNMNYGIKMKKFKKYILI